MALHLTNPSTASTPTAAFPKAALKVGIVLAALLLALFGCGGPDQGSPNLGPPPPPPPPPIQVPDVHPPTGLTIEVSGTRVLLSWTPPTPAPTGYRLLAGPREDALELVTGSILPGTTSLELNAAPAAWVRGTPFFVALQSSRNQGREYSAPSSPVQVTMPTLEPGTIVVECSVPHVNDGRYLTDTAFQGVYESGSCVIGSFRGLDTSAAFDRTYGSTYAVEGVGRVLDLGLVDSSRTTDTMDGPYPAMWFHLTPLSEIRPGTSWTGWVGRVGSGQRQIFGGIFELFDYYRWGSPCLRGVATAGSLTVTAVAGIEEPGKGSIAIKGSVTFVDPYTVPGVCSQYCCR